jgi:hypothetical protein
LLCSIAYFLIVTNGAKLNCTLGRNLISFGWWIVDGFCTERGA